MIKKGKISIDKRTTGILFILFVIAWMSGLGSAAGMVSPDGKSSAVDIGIFNSGCGDFEIRAKPLINLTETSVTNIVFTARWPENNENQTNILRENI